MIWFIVYKNNALYSKITKMFEQIFTYLAQEPFFRNICGDGCRIAQFFGPRYRTELRVYTPEIATVAVVHKKLLTVLHLRCVYSDSPIP